jgi:arylsulfatase
MAGDPANPDLNIAWKYLWTAKDTWLGPEQNLGAIGSVYKLTMDPFQRPDNPAPFLDLRDPPRVKSGGG